MAYPKGHQNTRIVAANDSDGTKSETISSTQVDLNQELIDMRDIDPALTNKMALVNMAIDEIGMTLFHWKLFFLNGFGYGADTVRKLPVASVAVSLIFPSSLLFVNQSPSLP
jgi:hypothetical protein